jgi:hypothetical protein
MNVLSERVNNEQLCESSKCPFGCNKFVTKYFVQQYLIPTEINKNKAKFRGAYIMDVLLSYNNTNGSQSLRDFWVNLFCDCYKDNENF